MGAPELWAAVVESYEESGLMALTNVRDRGATTINTAVGQNAAQAVIDLWPVYAQEAYDETDPAHVEVAKMGTIAVLWRRGGTATNIAKVEWDEVFSSEGLVTKVRRTGARGRAAPSSNSGVQQRSELAAGGMPVQGWSDTGSLPRGVLPSRRLHDPYGEDAL